ncbi:hypothetical protein QLQ12_39430 [Actinoplanes sp. NEAU-A12]|uniref:Uncharacterized protein n=1 Tax=Actinoplanes sandaracinus TaxID=3045177 RepID=A0ABT6WY62_9ACTN|nr:hypothetical protein [Actinoplanes sandaracinus]MDI6104681.1 hypothetical protein [Actinoplanes sandaracinus]
MEKTATLEVHDRLFALADQSDMRFETADWSTGLIAPMNAGAAIHAGVYRGRVTVTAVASREEPPLAGADQWDDIAEVSVNATAGALQVHQLQYGVTDAPPTLPDLSLDGPGWYRVRVYAHGRDVHHDAFEDDSGERYRIESWRHAPLPPLIVRATSRCGYSLRVSALTQPRTTADAEPPVTQIARRAQLQTRAALEDLSSRLRPGSGNQ